ncbi:hypothetical protein ACFOOP_03210 [Marinicaulis aureus]
MKIKRHGLALETAPASTLSTVFDYMQAHPASLESERPPDEKQQCHY